LPARRRGIRSILQNRNLSFGGFPEAPVFGFLRNERVNIRLTPYGEELLRVARERHPTNLRSRSLNRRSPNVFARVQVAGPPKRTREEFRTWLDEFTALSDKIPAMPGETFSREMIYQDHD
jgi:hypothetical protein